MYFPPFFHPLSIIFFPNKLFAIFLPPPRPGGGGQTEKYTPLDLFKSYPKKNVIPSSRVLQQTFFL